MTEPLLAGVATLWKRTGRRLVTSFIGTSMLPSIADGQPVELVCRDDVEVGDVIAYVYGDRVTVHRIVARWGDRFVTRGDANVLPDAMPVERNAIIGKIECGGRAPSAVQSMLLAVLTRIGERNATRIVGILWRMRRAFRRLR